MLTCVYGFPKSESHLLFFSPKFITLLTAFASSFLCFYVCILWVTKDSGIKQKYVLCGWLPQLLLEIIITAVTTVTTWDLHYNSYYCYSFRPSLPDWMKGQTNLEMKTLDKSNCFKGKATMEKKREEKGSLLLVSEGSRLSFYSPWFLLGNKSRQEEVSIGELLNWSQVHIVTNRLQLCLIIRNICTASNISFLLN